MTQTSPEISIIVPVYNVEKYLRQSLDSIQSQTFTDWECILVDDGSPDNSGAICDEYAARDPRFHVIHKENGGVSSARNAGLRECKGKYIGFVDPDDIAKSELMERLRDLLISYEADVAQVSFESLFTTFTRGKRLVESVVTLDRGQVALEMLYGKRIQNYLWNKLFRREVIDVMFPEGMVFEDVYALSQWTKNIKKMVLSPEILYTYRKRSGSIVNSNSIKNRLEYLQSVFSNVNTLREIEPSVISEDLADKYIWKGAIRAGKSISRMVDDPDERVNSLMKVSEISRSLKIPPRKFIGVKMWLRAHLLKNNPKLFMKLMRFVYKFDLHRHYCKNNQFD